MTTQSTTTWQIAIYDSWICIRPEEDWETVKAASQSLFKSLGFEVDDEAWGFALKGRDDRIQLDKALPVLKARLGGKWTRFVSPK